LPSPRLSAPLELSRIPPFEALERLLADLIWLGYPLAEDSVAGFLDWLSITPAYALTYGALDGVEESLRDLVQTHG